MRRPLFATLLAFLASLAAIAMAAGLAWYWLEPGTDGTAGGGVAAQGGVEAGQGFEPQVEMGGDFTLTGGSGERFALADLPTRYGLIYFGYTYCPDVCPTELQDMTLTLDAMDPAAAQTVTPLFVTVDPERDTPEAMAEYVGHFHPRMIGLTGAPAAIDEVASAYRVYYAKTGDTEGDGYLVDHSSYFYLVRRDGTLVRMFQPKAKPEDLAEGVAAAIAADAGPAS